MRTLYRLAIPYTLVFNGALAVSLVLPAWAARGHGNAGWRTIAANNFAGGAPGGWPTGNKGIFNAHMGGGRYTLSVRAGITRFETPANMLDVSDGQISATVQPEGQGYVGVAARMNKVADTGYTFWIDAQGDYGAMRLTSGMAGAIFTVYDPGVVRPGDNTLALRAEGGRLTFWINNHLVDRYDDQAPLAAGQWGIYVDGVSTQSATQGHYAAITIVGRSLAPPQELSTGPFPARFDYDFATGNYDTWYTGRTAHLQTQIRDGRYLVSITDSYAWVIPPWRSPALADGQIDAIVRLGGHGRVGVASRWIDDPTHGYTLYAFWIDQCGDYGATREANHARTTLFELHDVRVNPHRDNTLALRAQGSRLTFYLDDQRVFAYTDRHPLPAGQWGIYVDDYPGDTYVQGQYKRLLIAG